jgi:TonB-linked SusC/RagA family outer membrane protein
VNENKGMPELRRYGNVSAPFFTTYLEISKMFVRTIFTIKADTWRKILCMLCILCCCSAAFAQKKVSGKVVDADGETVIGANVMEKGIPSNGTVTDVDGNFSLNVQGSNAVLQISYIGYVTQEIATGSQTEINVTLLEDTQTLDEVVVVGYGTQKKVNLSGAVSTISAKTLENRPVTNANLALQGLAAGMNIRMSDSYATDAPDINIRGFTSINGGSAFILVDNVPVTPEELSRMNPSDIESASVLKDAASAAIYGARAAFGVVLITTKSAKSEKLTVDLDANYGLRSFIDFPELVSDVYDYMSMQILSADQPGRYTQEQLDYALRRRQDPSLPAVLSPEDALNPSNRSEGNWEFYAGSNWRDIFMKKYSPAQTYNVRVSQKGEKLSYAMSGGYYRQDGLMQNTINDVLDRYNFRGAGTYKMTKWWELGSNISFTRRSFKRSPLLNDSWGFYRVVQGYVTIPLYTPDGYAENDWLGELTSGNNKVSLLNESQFSFNTTVNLFKDVWTVKADANLRFSSEETKTKGFPFTLSKGPGKLETKGSTSAEIENGAEQYVVYNVYTDFHKTFADKHFVLAMAGFNQEYYKGESSKVGADWLLTPSLPTLQLTGPNSNISKEHGINTLALRGAFARLNYIFDNKYILELNGRYDGTSRYRKDDRFGFFPSGSLAWNLSKESFMKNVNELLHINNLKLRGSYGVLGNQMLEDEDGPVYYPYIPTMGYESRIDQMINGVQPAAVMQPGVVAGDLTWETVRTVNGGIDLNLFNNRFELNFDKYVRYTEGMLTKSKTLPTIFGATEPRANAANLKTKGWDLAVSWRDEFALLNSPFSYSVRLMLSDNRAFITKFDNPDKLLSHIENGEEVYDYYEGQEIGEVWGYETLGYFASDEEAAGWANQSALGNGRPFVAGDLKFRDVNEDGRINQGSNTVDDPGDRKIIGNKSYRFPYSADLSVEWKGFDLRVFLEGIGKRTAYPGLSHDGLWFWGQFTTPYGAMTVKNLDNWTYKGDAGYFPRVKRDVAGSGELAKVQTKYMQDASYLRVKNLALGYTLPRKLSGKAGISRLRVYVSAENPFTFHHIEVQGLDPERFDNVYYPFMKVVSLGMNISF